MIEDILNQLVDLSYRLRDLEHVDEAAHLDGIIDSLNKALEDEEVTLFPSPPFKW